MGQNRLVYSNSSWKNYTWVRIGSCNDELNMGDYGDWYCYFWKIYRTIRIYIVSQSYKAQRKPDGIELRLCLYKFRMEFYILDHCDCCCPHDHTTLYKSKSSRSGTLASTIWKKKVYELRWLHCMLQKNTKFKGIFVTKGMYLSSDLNWKT